jgi:hypothetical protein
MRPARRNTLGELPSRWRRALQIVFHPDPAWRQVVRENEGVGPLFVQYVLPLSLLPALAWTIGRMLAQRPEVISSALLAGGDPLRSGLVTALFSCLTPFLIAGLIRVVMSLGARRADYRSAYRVAAYAMTPLWLVGALVVTPTLMVAAAAAILHSLYLMTRGLEIVLGVDESTSAEFTAIVVMATNLALLPVGWLAAWMDLL